MKRLTVLIVLMAVAGSAYAIGDYMEFTGANGADWNDPCNWSTLDYAQQKKTSFTSAGKVPAVNDQVMIRDGRTVTVTGGYTANMGTVSGEPPSYVYNGLGAVEYWDGGDENKILWAPGGTMVVDDGNAYLAQGAAKDQKDYWVVGGIYGGEMIINAGTVEPDYYMYVGCGGDYTYTGMREPNDPNTQDPNYAHITPVGKLIMNGGTLQPYFIGSKGTKIRTYIGYAGGNGTVIINDGLIPLRNEEGTQKGIQLNLGYGTAPDAVSGASWGYMEFNGGSLSSGENLAVGYAAGKGKLIATGGTLDPGGELQLGMYDKYDDPCYGTPVAFSYGEAELKGTAVVILEALTVAQGNAGGTLTIKEDASMRIQSAVSKTDTGQNTVGRSLVYDGAAVAASPTGVVNVESGTFQYKPAASNIERGTFRLGWTWDKNQYATLPIYSRGEMNISGGVTLFEVGGTSKIALDGNAPQDQYFVLGSCLSNQSIRYASNATGVLNITGGSFITVGGSARIYDDPNNEETYLGDSPYVQAHVILAQHRATTGIMNIGRGAYVSVDGSFTMAPGSEDMASAKLIMDYDEVSNAVLNLTGVAALNDTLVVNDTRVDPNHPGYRLREGDKLVVIKSTDPCAVYFTGDFTTFETNITLGPQYVDPNDPNAGYLAFWGGNKNGGDYEAIFQGRTAGDCVTTPGTSSTVDGGDLAIMGGNWMVMGGMTWNDADFNGDGNVDGGDLALMGGNWMWVLSPPPPGDALPEPATLALLSLGAVAMIRRKR